MSNQEELKEALRKCSTKTNYKIRMQGIEELFRIDCVQRKDVLINLAIHDRVFAVKELAFRKCQSLKLTYKGKPIRLTGKDIGYKNSEIINKLLRAKREAKLDEFDLDVFKNKLLQIDPEMYDVLAYEKGEKFNIYLENQFNNLPKNK